MPSPKKPTQTRQPTLVNPVTSEREYEEDELEFMRALDQYRRENCRQFPTCSEVLAVAKSLGYRCVAERGPLPEFKLRASGRRRKGADS